MQNPCRKSNYALIWRAFGELDITDTFTTPQSILDGLTAPLRKGRLHRAVLYLTNIITNILTFPKDKFLFDKIEKNGLNTGLFQFYQPDII